LSGGALELADEGNHKWFSFQIEAAGGALVPPRNPDYTLKPISIEPGQSVKRAVNITPLYPITEYGIYRVRATVYDSSTKHYFSSNPPLNIEVSEGRMLWQQEVGVPGEKTTRMITLLSYSLPANTQLYLRIEDKENGIVYCTSQLGRFVSFGKPDIMIGANNEINILQNIAPKMFLFTHATLDGKITERKQYASTNNARPAMHRNADGSVEVIGGIFYDPQAIAAQQQQAGPPPSVSDRPAPVPKQE
ncbi:MAG: hypothetical protein ACREKL_01400, partial [Chthoniobacterales bacterium]